MPRKPKEPKHKRHIIKDYEGIFTKTHGEQISLEEHQKSISDSTQDSIQDNDIWGYRTKTITSGSIREVEIYPIFKTPKLTGRPAHKGNESCQAQKDLNYRNAQKRVARLINTNFTRNDMWITNTYSLENMPLDEKEGQKNITNYLKRLRRYLKKIGHHEELKYLYVTEYVYGKDTNTDKDTNTLHAHHHIVMNFPDRDMAEKLWGKGRTHARRLQPDDYGLEGLARYITKEKGDTPARKYAKKYQGSQNLAEPKITEAKPWPLGQGRPWRLFARQKVLNYKISKRKAATIAQNQNGAKELFENMNIGYIFNDITIKHSHYVRGVYIYARMRQGYDRREQGQKRQKQKLNQKRRF